MGLFNTYVKQQRHRFIDELMHFCGQPSIAGTGEGMAEMAEMVADRLRNLGAQTTIHSVGESYPFICGEIGEGPRTLLLYNHYDVQPANFEDGWTNDPFAPTLRGGRLYARGVADNKANLLLRIQAIESYLAVYERLPVRVRFIYEGEEEIGSPHLIQFVNQYSPLVQADGCLWESGRKNSEGRPLLQLGVRGILYVHLSLQADSREVHSSWGNIAHNPAHELLERLQQAVASLVDDAGRPRFGNLFEHIRHPTPTDLALLDAIPFDLEKAAVNLGVQLHPGLDRREALRRLFFEPTCTLCGFSVGYTGPSVKTVIPNKALAKIDFRLPPGLTPDLVEQQLRAHLIEEGFTDVVVQRMGALRPARTATDAAIVQATQAAIRTIYAVEPIVHPSMTASGPMYELCESQGVPAVTFGAGHPADNVHGTDENIYLDDYFRAMRTTGEIIQRFGAV